MTNQELIERYPYLRPINPYTGEQINTTEYTCMDDLPVGWHKMFLQMCEDIRQPLIDAGRLEIFQFSQLKEKFGTMRAYTWGAPGKVLDIIGDYECLSEYVCQNCGKPSTMVSKGWIGYFCDECAKKYDSETVPKSDFDLTHVIYRYNDGERIKEERDLVPLWNRLYGEE